MQTKPLIIWEKWQDPILNNLTDMSDDVSNDNTDSEYNENYNTEEDDQIFDHPKSSYKYPIIITPMGILPYNEKTSCDKIFNFWVGHTNFSITKEISDILEESIGVETLDIFTRYRFRIAIGKAFKDSKIMTNINNKIYEHINES
jgi:hypothetical protein